ncbi:MAG: preprotein translocase subunit YajC [Bacteroidota bacterium]
MFQNHYVQQLLFIILIVAIWYIFFLRPGNKEKETKKSFFDHLNVGDKIVTVGGIHGMITGLQDQQITIALGATARSTQMRIQKEAIAIEITQQIYPKEVAPKKNEKKV